MLYGPQIWLYKRMPENGSTSLYCRSTIWRLRPQRELRSGCSTYPFVHNPHTWLYFESSLEWAAAVSRLSGKRHVLGRSAARTAAPCRSQKFQPSSARQTSVPVAVQFGEVMRSLCLCAGLYFDRKPEKGGCSVPPFWQEAGTRAPSCKTDGVCCSGDSFNGTWRKATSDKVQAVLTTVRTPCPTSCSLESQIY